MNRTETPVLDTAPHEHRHRDAIPLKRYFLDTEFIDNGSSVDLISIGVVCNDGREYYAQSVEFASEMASPWVKEQVFPQLLYCSYTTHTSTRAGQRYGTTLLSKVYHKQLLKEEGCPLHTCAWRTRAQIRQELLTFFQPGAGFELWGWCSGYDFVVFCQLFGPMMDFPPGYPHYIRDFQYLLDERGISDEEVPPQEAGRHNALADARYLKNLWEIILRTDA